ncbi:MAG: site-2 protease family protein [Candidatus Paceibacterota bacterium]
MEFLIFQLIILLFSVVIHELSHGYVAEYLGDNTARDAGRLTLNPIKHLDMFGSIILPLLLFATGSSFIIGWAKPIPYNPRRLTKDHKYGPLKIALAGPLSNVLMALVFGLILRFSFPYIPDFTIMALGFIVMLNILLAVFNLLPIPPLDGSKIFSVLLPQKYSYFIQSIGIGGIMIVFLFLILFGGIIFQLTSFFSELIMGQIAWASFINLIGPAF